MDEPQLAFYHLSVSLALGLLIGVERGWSKRADEEGSRIAGIRTYGLLGLLGGAVALVSEHAGALPLALAFVGIAGVLSVAYVANLRQTADAGITSLVAGLLTFSLGALAGYGNVTVAAAAAVAATLLLGYKTLLHRWISALEAEELHAALKLLLISVVLLPLLPDQGYGPGDALNPYEIWWMVVLIASISFAGYFAIKIGGPAKGIAFTSVFAGLASSTALTLHFARLARRDPQLAPVLSAGILLACGTMFPRILLIAGVVNPELTKAMLVPVAIMAVLVYAPAAVGWSAFGKRPVAAAALPNPLELRSAIGFGVLLAVVMLLGKTLEAWFGDVGVLVLAAASGIADVDAITLSIARMNTQALVLHTAVVGVVLAAAVNTVVKAGMATVIAGRTVGLHVGLPMLASAAAGLLCVWLIS